MRGSSATASRCGARRWTARLPSVTAGRTTLPAASTTGKVCLPRRSGLTTGRSHPHRSERHYRSNRRGDDASNSVRGQCLSEGLGDLYRMGARGAAPARRRGAIKVSETFGKDRKSTRLNSSHLGISYAVFCLKKKKTNTQHV